MSVTGRLTPRQIFETTHNTVSADNSVKAGEGGTKLGPEVLERKKRDTLDRMGTPYVAGKIATALAELANLPELDTSRVQDQLKLFLEKYNESRALGMQLRGFGPRSSLHFGATPQIEGVSYVGGPALKGSIHFSAKDYFALMLPAGQVLWSDRVVDQTGDAVGLVRDDKAKGPPYWRAATMESSDAIAMLKEKHTALKDLSYDTLEKVETAVQDVLAKSPGSKEAALARELLAEVRLAKESRFELVRRETESAAVELSKTLGKPAVAWVDATAFEQILAQSWPKSVPDGM